jgi:hypothetical protein
MSVRNAAEEIVGKTIAGFVVKDGRNPNRHQIIFAANGGEMHTQEISHCPPLLSRTAGRPT